jgi:transcriptional regulator with XRE-family HTH domain
MASLGQRVRDFRYSKGWGLDELASRAEISRTAIYQIENGKTGSPHANTLRRIAVALDVSMDELLGHPESTAHQTTRTVTDHAVSASPGRECADWIPADGGLLALLPHEDPKQLADRIQQWITDMQSRNAVERDLVCHAARLAHRLRQAARTQTQMASDDPAHNSLLIWREIAPRPRDKTEALAVLSSVVDQHIGRLEELLAKYEEIEEEEAAERSDRAALDSSRAFEGHRRYQSTQTRELLRTLDTLRRMRNAECGTGNGEGEMADDKWGGFAGSEPGQLRGLRPNSAAHNAVGLAGESPAVGIDCLPT